MNILRVGRTKAAARNMKYTVLSASGWRGSGWKVSGFCDSLKKAQELQSQIQTTDARSSGYLTRIARGWGKTCVNHSNLCTIFDLRHVKRGERHLRGMVHADSTRGSWAR